MITFLPFFNLKCLNPCCEADAILIESLRNSLAFLLHLFNNIKHEIINLYSLCLELQKKFFFLSGPVPPPFLVVETIKNFFSASHM